MQAPIKKAKYSRYDVIRVSIKCFASTHALRMQYIMLVLFSVIAHCWMSSREAWYREIVLSGEYVRDRIVVHIVNILIINVAMSSMVFVKDFLFETHLSKYGNFIASVAMKRILYSERPELFEITGGQIEYYITEGSKEMAKIARQFLMSLPGRVFDLVFEGIALYYRDKSDGKMIFFGGLIVFGIMTAVKFYYIVKISKEVKKCTELSFEREKAYTEAIDFIPIVKAYGGEDVVITKYKERALKWVNGMLNSKFLKYFGKFSYDSLGAVLRISLITYYVYIYPTATGSNAKNLAWVIYRLLLIGVELVKIYQLFEESYVLTGTVLNYIHLPIESYSNKLRVDMFNEALEVRNLTYVARGRVIFSNVSMTLRKGEKVALYGRNGIGKSSIFKVLMNFDEFTGQVKLDGTDIRNFLMADYRKLITYVPQDTKLFDDTVYGNLIFGSDCSYEEVMQECVKLKIHDKIMFLPNGYNTMVGEGGKNLNGGLRQKIFYARAFLRNTPIYLFDEPTNNLDSANAQFLLEYINDPKYKDKTFLVICHDMGIVEQFPKIYKFTEGDIVLEKE